MLTDTEFEQIKERYTAAELIDDLDIDICEVVLAFEDTVEEHLTSLLDVERGIDL